MKIKKMFLYSVFVLSYIAIILPIMFITIPQYDASEENLKTIKPTISTTEVSSSSVIKPSETSSTHSSSAVPSSKPSTDSSTVVSSNATSSSDIVSSQDSSSKVSSSEDKNSSKVNKKPSSYYNYVDSSIAEESSYSDSSIILPEVSDDEISLPGAIGSIIDSPSAGTNLWLGIISCVFIAIGVIIIISVLYKGGKKTVNSSPVSRKRYKTRGNKYKLSDKYYKDIHRK